LVNQKDFPTENKKEANLELLMESMTVRLTEGMKVSMMEKKWALAKENMYSVPKMDYWCLRDG
jgi:hypothetical protein